MNNKNKMLIYTLPFLFFLLLFLFVPLISMIISSIKNAGGAFTLENYAEIFGNFFYIQSFINSIGISLLSSLVGAAAGAFVSHAMHSMSSSASQKILVCTNLTANFAGVPLAFSFIVLLGNSGILILLSEKLGIHLGESFNLYSWSGICLTYVYFQIPLAVMLIFPLYNAISESWLESATLLGAHKAQFWRRVGIPTLLPGILGTTSILFANSMGAYVTAYTLTGSAYNLLAVRIGSLISGDIFARPELGSALGVCLGAILVGTVLLNQMLMRRLQKDVQI